MLVHTTLNNAKQRIRILQTGKLIQRTFCPAQRQLHRFARGFYIRRIRRAFVKLHHDVRIEYGLNLHRAFGRQKQLVAIHRRAERHALLGDFAQIAQAEHLKTARIGQNRLVPIHKLMQTAVHLHHIHARTQPQVKSIAQNNLCIDFAQHIGCHALDRAISANRHKNRRLHHAVIERHRPATRFSRSFV